jgi:Uma2 family endonuclease
MTLPTTRRRLTAEEFLYQPPDDLRSELVAGEVVREPPPGPEHGWLGVTIAYHLRRFLEEHPLGRVLGESGYVLARDPDTVRGPDVSFVAEERWAATPDKRRYFEGAPDLAVEIASPDDSRRQLAEKARSYLAAGARLVWVVWPGRETVEVYRRGSPPAVLSASATLDGGDVLPGFTLPLSRIFGD